MLLQAAVLLTALTLPTSEFAAIPCFGNDRCGLWVLQVLLTWTIPLGLVAWAVKLRYAPSNGPVNRVFAWIVFITALLIPSSLFLNGPLALLCRTIGLWISSLLVTFYGLSQSVLVGGDTRPLWKRRGEAVARGILVFGIVYLLSLAAYLLSIRAVNLSPPGVQSAILGSILLASFLIVAGFTVVRWRDIAGSLMLPVQVVLAIWTGFIWVVHLAAFPIANQIPQWLLSSGTLLIQWPLLGMAMYLSTRPDKALRGESSVDLPMGKRLGAYLALTKPIITGLLLLTTLGGMVVAQQGIPEWDTILFTLIGGGFTAGGSSALNHYVDRYTDRFMHRTRRRPLPSGILKPFQVITFGLLLILTGLSLLALAVNPLTAFLAFSGVIYYVILYSVVLKPTTVMNIVIGGGAGAIPPLVGWAAVTGSLSMPAVFLFALVFFWTPPHFWALAMIRDRDYLRAGIPMLPVVYGSSATRLHILLYSIQLFCLTLLLPLAGLGGYLLLLATILLGSGLIYYAWKLWREGGNKVAWRMYRYSSLYLAFMFLALMVDAVL